MNASNPKTIPTRRPIRLGISLLLAVLGMATAFFYGGHQAATAATDPYALDYWVIPAPEWDAIFDRNGGWTGADGIYSIPLNQDERPGAYTTTDTFFVYSDTFVGKILPDGSRYRPRLVNNSMSFSAASAEPIPDAGSMRLYFARDEVGLPRTLFTPTVDDAAPGEWYWMKDGIALDDTLYLLASRFRWDDEYVVWREGVTLIEIPEGSQRPFDDHSQTDVPLLVDLNDTQGAVVFGASIMPLTTAAGAPNPDGYIYIYGTREDTVPLPNKRVLVARVPEAEFANIAAWRFYDGSDWVADIHDAAPITGRASVELSVSPLPDGRFIMVFLLDQVGARVAIRVGQTPWGPWGPHEIIYRCPEREERPLMYCYNAKAHPHLSEPGELLISYNVNTFNDFDHLLYSDIYRPRFIRLLLGDS